MVRSEGILEGVQGLLDRAVADTVDSHLQPSLVGIQHKGIGLLLSVIYCPNSLCVSMSVIAGVRGIGEDGVHEYLHSPSS